MSYSNGLLNFKNENKLQVIIKGEKDDLRVGFKLTERHKIVMMTFRIKS